MKTMSAEAIVYGHTCLSQARLLERLEKFKKKVPNFCWRMATPEEQKHFLRKNTILVFPVVQIGKDVIQGIPEIHDLEQSWNKLCVQLRN